MIVVVPDELIMAYADGEIAEPLKARVREAIWNDSAVRRKYEMFLATRSILASAFDPVLREPVPARLKRAVAARKRIKPN